MSTAVHRRPKKLLLQVGAGVCDLREKSAEEQTQGLQAEAGKRGQPRGPEITGEFLIRK